MHYDFELAGRHVRLWQRLGEGYGHVLMKALGFAMYVEEFPMLHIEQRVRSRYKPDLVAHSDDIGGRSFSFWGECGMVSMRKIAWLLKHGGARRLVLFKIDTNIAALAEEIRSGVEARYRPAGRLRIVNFVEDIIALTESRKIARVPQSWYTETLI
jgi:hypothetical protein